MKAFQGIRIASSAIAVLAVSALILSGCGNTPKPTELGEQPDSGTRAVFAAKPAAGSNCAALPSGIVSWWTGDGDANDLAGGNNGTLLNGATFAPGMVGQGFSLDGVDDRVSIPDSPDLDITGDITMEAWFRSDSPNGGIIVGKENPVAPVRTGYVLHVNPAVPAIFANSVAVNFFSPSGAHINVNSLLAGDPTNYNDGAFHHVAGTYTAADGMARLYIDGQLIGTSPQAPIASIGTNNLPVIIGDRPGSPLPFNGVVDEVSIYNRALSESEIQAIYAAGSAGKCRAEAVIPNLLDGVAALVASGVLNEGQGNALSSKLNNALRKLESGNVRGAAGSLRGFIGQVGALVNSGTLTPAEGQALDEAASELIRQLIG